MTKRADGVLTLTGEGSDPRVSYDVVFDIPAGKTVRELSTLVSDQMAAFGGMSFQLDPVEYLPGSWLAVRSERIYSLVISPSEDEEPVNE